MGVLDLNFDDGGDRPAGGDGRRGDRDRRPATVWVNVGFVAVDPESGERTFIGLPMGIPVDTMKPARGKGWLTRRKNALHYRLMHLAGRMEPGAEGVVGQLQVQLRRVAAEDPKAQAEAMQDLPRLELIPS